MTRILLIALLMLAGLAAPVSAQTSKCANCHLANMDTPDMAVHPFMARHYADWDHSAHGRHDVGCEKCHGGNATSFERVVAHQGVLPARDAKSPTNWANLPRTCGACHTGPFVLFQKSKHFELLKAGDPRVPTCSTCHGEVAARLLSPAGLEHQCNRCHGEGRTAPRPERAANARMMLAGVTEVRELLDQSKGLIRRIRDKAKRAEYEAAWQQAEVPLIEARQAGHMFEFGELQQRLDVARTRAGALLEKLANP